MDNVPGKLHQLFEYNFLEYTSYVIRERAIPAIDDGLKPVQRRILQTLFNMEDGRFHKVANLVGETMKLHPHGDASIFSALVNLANKGFLIERQGNFGNIFTGDSASAPRYIECRLSPLAKEVLFNKDITEFIDSYDGRMVEPVTLPAKLPLLLLQGAEGIAVGMATKIMPHNFCELLQAQKAVLLDEEFTLYPDFPQGGLVDVSGYEDGNGKIKCRARIRELNEKTIIIDEIPYSTTTQSLTDSIEKAAKAGKIKIISINDYTAEKVEIEIKVARGIYAKDTIKALYAFTDCEVPISPNLTLIKGKTPATSSVREVIEYNTLKLKADLTKELEINLARLEEKLHARLLEQIFIEQRLYKNIEEETSYESIMASVDTALIPFRSELFRDVTEEDVTRLLEIRIKRISRFDINKQDKEIRAIRKDIKAIKISLKDMVAFTIASIDKLLAKYGENYPRKTEIKQFSEVVVRKIALSNLTVGYSRETGFLGHSVKGEEEEDFSVTCSEYDRLFLIYSDGRYKVIPVTDKVFAGTDLKYIGIVPSEQVFNIVYRDGNENFAYVKRFNTPKFILEKEYHLFPEHKRSKILLMSFGEEKYARVNVMPSARAKTNTFHVAFDDYLVKGASAKGKRVSPRVVRRVLTAGPPTEPKKTTQNLSLLTDVEKREE
ncbi:DNA topoisomerase IV subunit A [Desulfotalea psychrophila]|uniref:Probable topoisomerase IV, subunit A n=1 Tax=Desulfotalea psychrophila (strain LSv54 / DSM 12343) TaxID=177439 RepID=Q6AKW5_DESPS|nr:DNA topoisomerase IV subunit A [Desulfotalea psychrophila]CAG37010.1 probable topoisomerase IV, subunit A [Desulfotalea psychrophila LSv54]